MLEKSGFNCICFKCCELALHSSVFLDSSCSSLRNIARVLQTSMKSFKFYDLLDLMDYLFFCLTNLISAIILVYKLFTSHILFLCYKSIHTILSTPHLGRSICMGQRISVFFSSLHFSTLKSRFAQTKTFRYFFTPLLKSTPL